MDPFGMAMHGLTGEDAEFMRKTIDHIRRGAPPSEPIDERDATQMARGFRMRDRLKGAGFDTSPSEADKYPRGVNLNLPEGHGATLSPNEPHGWHVRTFHRGDRAAEHIHHDLPDSDEAFPAALHRYYGSPQIQKAMKEQRWSIRPQASLDPLISAFMSTEAVSGYDISPRSGMISLDMPGHVSQAIAEPGGVGDHHITVAYLGPDVDDEAFEHACKRAQDAASRMSGPVMVLLNGVDTFEPSASSDGKRPAIIPARLTQPAHNLRADLADLSASEFPDWKPHVTLAYLGEGEPVPQARKPVYAEIPALSVHRGDEVRHFPFGR